MLSTLILVLVVWMAVRFYLHGRPIRGPRKARSLPIAFRNGEIVVTGDRDRSWLGLLLAAGIGWLLARHQDRRDLVSQADAIPHVRCQRCGRELTAMELGWSDPRGSVVCKRDLPHMPTTAAPERREASRAELPF